MVSLQRRDGYCWTFCSQEVPGSLITATSTGVACALRTPCGTGLARSRGGMITASMQQRSRRTGGRVGLSAGLGGESAETPWDPELVLAMRQHKVRIEEELVLDALLEDLSCH